MSQMAWPSFQGACWDAAGREGVMSPAQRGSTGPAGGAVLEASKLCLRFGAVEALRSVSLAVTEGQIHSVIGPNGAGKSSLLNCLSGFYRPQSGTVRFRGEEISHVAPHDRAALGIGRTFQGIQTYPSLTARQNILTV